MSGFAEFVTFTESHPELEGRSVRLARDPDAVNHFNPLGRSLGFVRSTFANGGGESAELPTKVFIGDQALQGGGAIGGGAANFARVAKTEPDIRYNTWGLKQSWNATKKSFQDTFPGKTLKSDFATNMEKSINNIEEQEIALHKAMTDMHQLVHFKPVVTSDLANGSKVDSIDQARLTKEKDEVIANFKKGNARLSADVSSLHQLMAAFI